MSVNSAVLDEEKAPLPLNSLERTKLRFGRVIMTVHTGLGYPGASKSYHGEGALFCSNYRMVFVCEPALPLFESFFVTWNKVDEGCVHRPTAWWWGRLLGGRAASSVAYQTTVHPVEGDASLDGPACLKIVFSNEEEAEAFAACVKESRWTGHLDPENTAEPPPPYPVEPSPPPKYDEVVGAADPPARDDSLDARSEGQLSA